MPLYEYQCDACGGRFEVIQKFSETSTECRVCGKGPVRKLLSSPAIQFKGSGFYITDYAKKSTSEAGSKSSSSSDSSSSSTEIPIFSEISSSVGARCSLRSSSGIRP